MKKLLAVFAVVTMSFVACGGGGGGGGDSDDGSAAGGDASGSASEDAGSSLSAENAEATTAALSVAAVGVTQAINSATPAAMTITKEALETLKDTGSFSGTAIGSGGGSCELTGSGASELESDPMTFSVSGTMVCDSYATTASTSSGEVDISLDGTISTSMSGSISQNYSSVEMSFTMNWSDLVVTVGDESFSAVAGDYTLSLTGDNGDFSLVETGTIGGQTVSRTYSYTYAPSYDMVSFYDNFNDGNYLYVDTRNYLGAYTAVDPALNTCPVNTTAYINTMSSSSLYFNARGVDESASGELSSVADMYFYIGYADTFYCTFGVSSANIIDLTYDFFTSICYDNSDVRLCSAGWSKLSRYDATDAPIKDVDAVDEKVVEALHNALDSLEECNEIE